MGVEEEYLLADPDSRLVRPVADTVIADAATELGHRVGTEITQFQVEARTDPRTELADLGDQIRHMRSTVAGAAATREVRAISSGTAVLGELVPPPISTGQRYASSVETFRALDDEQSACSCHVHIGLADRAVALQVSNHLRPWLPTLVAISANSPYWAGRDTGYASWRTLAWMRWPAAGPPPVFHSPGHFDDLVGRLSEAGAIMDPAGVYWDVRPSTRAPTVEIRATDAATTAGETLLYAALVRALVATALTAIDEHRHIPDPTPELLRAAYWRAARDGLTGHAVDPGTGHLVPATARADALLTHVKAAIRHHGDTDLVEREWRRLGRHGTGADRQRTVFRRRGQLTDVVDHLTLTATAPTERTSA
ncbi:glutamate--cysteine ligase [Amycolatopsis minnesotensis]|uniref:Putative glutamate--cysteine ligase 2 n=1 Tax=Amycolatopsis minnesotensis TaxID=337894 RepID=A0ABN2QSM6_9PSEU